MGSEGFVGQRAMASPACFLMNQMGGSVNSWNLGERLWQSALHFPNNNYVLGKLHKKDPKRSIHFWLHFEIVFTGLKMGP